MIKRLTSFHLHKGFTLVELMIVMTVMAILSGVILYGAQQTQQSARDVQRQQIMTGLQGSLERFYQDNKAYYTGALDFCGVAAGLYYAFWPSVPGYISAIPTDPGDSTHICTAAGGGNRCCTGTSCSQDNSVNGASCTNGAWYGYTSTGQTYVLTLKKESGGIMTFNSP